MSGEKNSKYKPEYDEQAYKLCLLGMTDKKIAGFFEVAESTINLWKLEHPTFSESLKRGKGLADADVAHSLYNRALGYEHDADDIKVVEGAIVITPTIKRYPPDATSAIFWLKNRQPEIWRDKPEVESEDDSQKKAFNITFNVRDPVNIEEVDESSSKPE